MRKTVPLNRKLAAGVAAMATAAATLASLGLATPATATSPSVTAHRIKVNPTLMKVSDNTDATAFTCQTRPIDGSQGIRCESPAQMQKAYGIAPLLSRGVNGTGRTIVIVDAYQNPYIASDLQTFDTTFDLPDTTLTNYVMPGTPAYDGSDLQTGWGEETTLDVLWAHAIAPGAKIELVSAASSNDTDILAATQYAVDNNLGDVLSQSFGENETCVDPTLLAAQHATFQKASRQGWTMFASSGDSGAAQFTCDGTAAALAPSSPANDPLITGVGGTTLNAAADGTYIGETAWTEGLFAGCNPPAVDPADINCSGGGYSTIYRKPVYQIADVRGGARGVPDVSYNAGTNGGVLTVCSICDGGVPSVFLFGGTSAGSPQWAALAALGDQLAHRRLGDINPELYGLSHLPGQLDPLHDVTVGNNDVAEIGTGYNAGRRWDAVTGLGTPNATKLLPALALLGRLGLRGGLHHLKAHRG